MKLERDPDGLARCLSKTMRPDSWISVKLSPGAPLNNEAGLVIVRLELLGPKNKNKRKATSSKLDSLSQR